MSQPDINPGDNGGMPGHYNLIVLGGGSGGLACAKEAASFGKKVAVLDYVSPSPRGTQWQLGGTCVNVGCIPKKLMHQASLVGHTVQDAKSFGWSVSGKHQLDWKTLAKAVQSHVKSLNFGHRVQLKQKNVDYFNMKGILKDKNTVLAIDTKNVEKLLTADFIVIATGTRPQYPSNVPGLDQYAISSDDIFWMNDPPGKTLCIGASYVSLETAGFLTGLGIDTTVLVRSVPLRRFDRQMSDLVMKEMEQQGTKFHLGATPQSVAKNKSGRLVVEWKGPNGQMSDIFDSVFVAVGRYATTNEMGLKEVGVAMNDDGFIIGNHDGEAERSSISNIFAIGDVLENCPQLTPVAIKSGKLLARRLFDNAKQMMDLQYIPTTVYTPIEYSFVGMNEEEAIATCGETGVTVYHAFYKPLEFVIAMKQCNNCYIKVITNKSPNEEVLGIHYTGPNAGEVMQGFAVAMRCGLTKDRLFSTVGIHPTSAEEVVKLHITKESGLDPTVTGC